MTDIVGLRTQTPSPKPTRTQAKQSSPKITSTFGFSVSGTSTSSLSRFQYTLDRYLHDRYNADALFLERNGRKTLTTVQGLPKKFDQKKILKVIKKKFACNGTIVNDTEMGEVIQLQGDQRKDVQEFLVDKKDGLELDAKTIKVHGF
ncbi:MAG: Eukaryotic translation initiation factor eIF-1 [Candelina mexicana]|nr:MAG: Eukaryotic translation initiation factor eIF-1 [Candelina mexicana]